MDLKISWKIAKMVLTDPKFIRKDDKDIRSIEYKTGVVSALSHMRSRFGRYASDDEIQQIPAFKLPTPVINFIYDACLEDKALPSAAALIQQISMWRKIDANPTGGTVSNPSELKSSLESYIGKSKNRLLFRRDIDDNLIAYLVTDIVYSKARAERGYTVPAQCSVKMSYIAVGKKEETSQSWTSLEIKKNTVLKELLYNAGYFLESEEILKEYDADSDRYFGIKSNVGEQYWASGHAQEYEDDQGRRYWWSRNSWDAMIVEGNKTMIIIDDPSGEFGSKKYDKYQRTYWYYGDAESSDEHSDFEELPMPEHPYVIAYNKYKDSHVKIHVNNIELYQYDPTIKNKLVLPEQDTDLIDMLVEGEGDIMGDIIAGKSSGIIIFATGRPGLGKTLTAEVYSEVVSKPLYIVQSSRLGINIESLEKNLKIVLARASRWNAILLIDEADVYIKERGDDIVQNAVVGTFLRILEYYKGILFMTSNKGDVIDDAILSRGTAHIRYQYPNDEQRRRLWEIFINQYKVEIIGEELLDELVKEFQQIGGRDIKNIIRLAGTMSRKKKKKLDIEIVRHVSKFKDIKTE